MPNVVPPPFLELTVGLKRIIEARHHDPFSELGYHQIGAHQIIRVFHPEAEALQLADQSQPFERITGTDIFVLTDNDRTLDPSYRLLWTDRDGAQHLMDDPYRFPPLLGDTDLYLFNEGRHHNLYDILGAHEVVVEGVAGTRFAVWAPGAARVSIVGDFNRWDGRVHPMRSRGQSGVWELFLPGNKAGELYKYEILQASDNSLHVKQDPFANQFEVRPATGCKITPASNYQWSDEHWLRLRAENRWQNTPMSIYEVHPGSWQQQDDGQFLNYRQLADKLVEYVQFCGFTHIELLPITEHPLDDSWGYQVTGYFAPSSRFGSPDDLRYLIDKCHQSEIGVILDWVPAHFPRDIWSLARFDGSCLFEHEDPRQGEHRDWGTLIFNYGRREVSNFLIASALYWLREFHLDGLRVDAVASMLFLDYSRNAGDWLPNRHGGRENLEAIDFIRELNHVTQTEVPGAVIIAEESTSWPQVTRPADHGGLGFSMKWNMGWMHDTLTYMGKEPVHRKHHHNQLTFGILYVFTENFVLPFSHDEVVHGKGSLLSRMPGDDWQQFANLRLLFCYQFTYPGKKLLFQGCEFAQRNEWNFRQPLDWHLTDAPAHRSILNMICDLNRLYRETHALYELDFDPAGFEWISCDDADQSVLSYIRRSSTSTVLVVLNFTPVPRDNYRIGVDSQGTYTELFNSDSALYGGSNVGNDGTCVASDQQWMGRNYSVTLSLPPLAGIILQHNSSADDA